MNTSARSQVLEVLRGRREAISDSWYEAIARASHVPLSAAKVRQHLVEWTEQAVELLAMESFERDKARDIGAGLARLHYIQSQVLSRTLEILALRLVEGLPADQAVEQQPRLAALLEGLAAGFLQEVHDQLKERVRERTAELQAANEELCIEIAERKRVEEALQESEATTRALLNAPTDVVALIVDTQGIISEANETMARRFHIPVYELVGSCVWDLFPLNATDRRKEYFDQVIWSGKPLRFEDERRGIWNDNALYPIFDGQGEVARIAVIARDITERKRVEEALHQSIIELNVHNQELDAFAHTVAHELQNPLAVIISLAEVMKENCASIPDEELQKHWRTIARVGRKMNRITAGLLLLAQVRKMKVGMEPLDMAIVTARALQRVANMTDEYQAEIIVHGDWPVALGYGPWVEEVWVNLLSNAIRFGGQPLRLELGATTQPDGQVRFWVRDNGSGIPPQEQARLFAPLGRLSQVHAKGHRLGLSVVQRIVEKLGGRVEVESDGVPGRGSVFSFTLPGVASHR